MKEGIKYIVGTDEVGRGLLVGPLAVGAFLAPTDFDLNVFAEARDSKKMTAQKREECFKLIKAQFGQIPGAELRFTVSFISPQRIDKVGLTKSTRTAINNCLRKFKLNPEECLVLLDGGLKAPKKYLNQKTIIKGDDKQKIISLASIVAKVTRDRRMTRISKKHPRYNFHKHKGYGTR